MAAAQNKKWALDTNVILDLGRKIEAALSLREIGAERGYGLYATPTVLQELFHLSTDGLPHVRVLACQTLAAIPSFGITPLILDSGSQAIAWEFSRFLRENRALPDDEVNDGVILAEASLANAALLVSSDSHLVSIDPDELRMYFEARDLIPIPVTTPRKILGLFERWRKITGRY